MNENRRNRFAVAAITLFILFAFGFVARIDMEAEIAATVEEASIKRLAAERQAITERDLALGYAQCPPREPGTTGVVTLIIKESEDGPPEVGPCIRFSERPFVPKTRRNSMKLVAAQ